MSNAMRKIGKYFMYFLWSNAIYGLMVYNVFTWLSEHSILLAYFGNLALIIFGLSIDEYMQSALQSDKVIAELKAETGRKNGVRTIHWITDSFVSFKTSLYLFYVIILIISQIIRFDPSLVGENIRTFISANDYSILVLIALDTLIKQFLYDRDRMQTISENLQKALGDAQD